MKILILSQRYSIDSRIIRSAATELGWETYRIQGDFFPDWVKEQEIYVYCEGFMAEFVSQETGVAILRPLIDSLIMVPPQFLGRKVEFKTIAELVELEKPTFIKPADQKFFEAGIYSSLGDINGFNSCDKKDPVFLSEVVEFVDEYRLFCCDGKVCGSSPYVQNRNFVGNEEDLPHVPSNIIEFGNQILSACQSFLPPGVVVDVGCLPTGELALIEFNPAWASGIYGVDPFEAIKCIERSCVQRQFMTKELEKFEIF